MAVRVQQVHSLEIEIDLINRSVRVSARSTPDEAVYQRYMTGNNPSKEFLVEFLADLFEKLIISLLNSHKSIDMCIDEDGAFVRDAAYAPHGTGHALGSASYATFPTAAGSKPSGSKTRSNTTPKKRRKSRVAAIVTSRATKKAPSSETSQHVEPKEPALDEDDGMKGYPVPDYFQDEGEAAQRSQVKWLEHHMGMGDIFFAGFLHAEESSFRGWREHRESLSLEQQEELRGLWQTMLHLLSFLNFDAKRVRNLLDHEVPSELLGVRESPFFPSWKGSSMRAYLEERGTTALAEIDRWVTAFRFGDPYAA